MVFTKEPFVQRTERDLVLEIHASLTRLWVSVVAELSSGRRESALTFKGFHERRLRSVEIVQLLDFGMNVSTFQREAVKLSATFATLQDHIVAL